jgi:hypothetical protein
MWVNEPAKVLPVIRQDGASAVGKKKVVSGKLSVEVQSTA